MKTTAVLSVSGKTLNCASLARALASSGIRCDISRNLTVIGGQYESGCRITSTVNSRSDISKIWDIVGGVDNVRCGHLKVDGSYSGCVLDYLRTSLCPGAASSKVKG